jgi:hypothetical protein
MHAGHSPLVIRQKIVMHIYIQLVEGGHDQYSVPVGSIMTIIFDVLRISSKLSILIFIYCYIAVIMS